MPLLITSVGDPYFNVVGYAKLAILNGYSNVFGYLGQYFDRAYRANPNGTRSTNETGYLSPYGYFFPTEPGRTILTTMPDGVSTNVGECTVHVIGLNVDANHDGVMDLSLTGPDQTSRYRPFVFWVNNDNDVSIPTGYHLGIDLDLPKHSDSETDRINSQRDLEDYARLWVCGIPALTNAGWQVTLSWANVAGSNPSIKLFNAVETNGGTGYLTDTNIAAAQLSPANNSVISTGTVATNQSFTFPVTFFTNASNKYLLFEGGGVGRGELVLTISQGTNVLAQTSVWLDLRNIKDLYDLAWATNVTSSVPPSGLISGYWPVRTVAAAPDEAEEIVIFVHGINNPDFEAANTAETAFKRLYWSGYRGRFVAFRWPCAYLPNEGSINPLELLKAWNFNKGEFFAWKSAAAFRDCLTALHARFPDYTLNVLAHSQGSVVFSEAVLQGAPFDNCILTQGAIPASCYDPAAPTLQKLLSADSIYPTPDNAPMGYRGCFTNIPGNVVNFFNTNDFALVSGTVLGMQANWEENQRMLKPHWFLALKYYHFDGTNCLVTGDYEGGTTAIVTDPHEQKSMVARSRTAAVGGSAGLGGVIDTAFDLGISLEFGQTRKEHSAQFTRPEQTVWRYYNRLMIEIGLQPALQP